MSIAGLIIVDEQWERKRMTYQECVIVSAYTGVLMCDFQDMHEYIETKLNRPVFTHEFADVCVQDEIKKSSQARFYFSLSAQKG